jgi:hypothetical protein
MRRCFVVLLLACLVIATSHANESSTVVPGSGIPIEPDGTEIVAVKKIPVIDCRVVRGFLGTPVDGSVKSWDYWGRMQ